MNLQFGSQHIAFNVLLPSGIWETRPAVRPFPWLKSAPLSLIWHDQRGRHIWLSDHDPDAISEDPDFRIGNGSNHLITMEWERDPGSLHIKIEFALSDRHPILQWRFHVANQTGNAVYLDWIPMLHTGSIGRTRHRTLDPYTSLYLQRDAGNLGLGFEGESPEFAFYTNGWQSWNYAGTLDINDACPWSKFGPINHPVRINAGTPQPKMQGHFVSDFYGVFGDRMTRKGFILGFLSQRQVFGTIEGLVDPVHPTLRMWANLDGVSIEPDQTFITDWAYLEIADLTPAEPISNFFEAVAIQNDVKRDQPSPVGWCSWYHAYESVSEKWMMDNINWGTANRERIPLDIIQLDDGYENEVGDWFSWKESFPDGIEPICNTIRAAGFKPGIWIAPFIAKRRSEIARDHPQWILRNRFKFPVNPGFLWNTFPFALDITHPEVMEHLHWIITKFVQEMGFEYLKLDFLYAGALPGSRYDVSRTRAQSLYQALQLMRDAAGEETLLLGCGCPIGSGIGIFDVMRIGPDVAPRWKPYYKGIERLLETEQGFPSARNAILTTVNRLPMHKHWWVNDPDCLIVRSSDTHLSQAEVQTLASVIAMSGGALILSDHLPSLSEERVDWFARLIPPLPQSAIAMDWFDTSHPSKLVVDLNGKVGSWKLILLINWADEPTDLYLNFRDFDLDISSHYHLFDFWNERYQRSTAPEIQFKDIPAHGACMLAVREVSSDPQWVGDTLHISQGLIVKEWQFESGHLYAQLVLGRESSGKAWIALPQSPKSIKIDEKEIAWNDVVPGICQVELGVDQNALLWISW